MEERDACLIVVTQHCSVPGEILSRLFHENDSFRSLCQDLRDCLKARDYWCRSGEVAGGRCDEYTKLSEELKAEIEQYAADFVKKRSNGDGGKGASIQWDHSR
jgi:hypothetical protein